VILDVVYNHTGEGSHLGPTLAFRGLDNAVYYRLQPGQPAQYEDFTGCGNTLNVRHPQVLKLVMDSLRYWVTEMRVDGFRFDLAPALGRETGSFDPSAAFFDAIHQDPILSGVKLIAEPWDLGDHGFQVGRFPAGWSEWNARYRDGVRRYWRGDRGLLPELATRVAGSSDLYQGAGRQPTASINFVTCHDGFTLRDLVSYTQKRNEANGEHNNDGESNNLSTNGGIEGPTADATIEAGRLRLVRNFLATLFVSQGVPMICAGDEMGRTQRGNNNAYCQDNEVSWVNWTLTPAERQLLEFTRSLIVIRHAHQVLRRRRYFDGQGHNGDKDVVWYDPRGREMSIAAWNEDTAVVGMRISATVVDERTGLTDPHEHDVLVALFNAGPLDIGFVLPKAEGAWVALFDTSDETSQAALAPRRFVGGERFPLRPRSVVLLRAEPPPTAPPEPPVARLRNRPRRRAADFRR
jgi:glycogen operon protein